MEMPAKDHCKQGHPFTADNVKIIRNTNGTTKRRCLICHRTSCREYQRRQQAKKPAISIQSFADKVGERTSSKGDCLIWTGQLQRGRPVLFHGGKYHHVRKVL